MYVGHFENSCKRAALSMAGYLETTWKEAPIVFRVNFENWCWKGAPVMSG